MPGTGILRHRMRWSIRLEPNFKSGGKNLDSVAYLYYTVVEMPKPESVGQFEQLVLTAILSLREDAYGVTIHAKVEDLAHPKVVSLGAIYVTLDRLEDKGMVSSWLSDPTPERGGRAKRCYRLEALGERVVAFFIPPACREEVLGDLHERFLSTPRYVADALSTVPLVIVSRIRRSTDPVLLLMEAIVLFS